MTARFDTIGVIACSFPGAALCVESICREAERLAGPHQNPAIALHMLNFAEHVAHVAAGNSAGLGQMLRESAHALAKAGAGLLICPDNTAHLGLAGVDMPLPFLHIAEPLAVEARARGLRKLGLMGTARLTRSRIYHDPLATHGVEVLRPADEDVEALDACIFGELTRNTVSPEGRVLARRIAGYFEARGCDALILGCTELPLLFGDQTLTALPLLDSNLLLAQAATRAALVSSSSR